jgi:hypothetical protein
MDYSCFGLGSVHSEARDFNIQIIKLSYKQTDVQAGLRLYTGSKG